MSMHTEWANRILSCKDDDNLIQILKDQEERYEALTSTPHANSLTLIYRVPTLALAALDSLKIYRKSTDQLTAFNDFSTARFTEVQKHLEIHTKLIKEIKTDLDTAFRKIR